LIDSKIIERCKRKDEQAFKLCYEACAPYVYTIIKNYISHADYRRDAMQEIFSQIFVSLPNYDERKGAFKPWVAQITIYQCINILRKRKKLNMFLPLDAEIEVSDFDEVLDGFRKEDMEKLLVKMPQGYKAVFLLNIIDGYPHKDIAELLDISENTSRSQLSRAIGWIKKNLSVETKKYIYG